MQLKIKYFYPTLFENNKIKYLCFGKLLILFQWINEYWF